MKKILLIFLILVVSSHAWWNESWPHRVSFNITEMQGSDWNDKAVLVRFPLNASCNDIRLIESNNEIPYSTPEDCILEFLDNFSAWSSNSYYIYYGSNITKPEYNHTLLNILDLDHDFQNLPTVDYDGYTSAKHGNWKLTSGGNPQPQVEKESKGIWKGNYFGESENRVAYHSVTGSGGGVIYQTWHFTTYDKKPLYMLDDSRVSYYLDETYNEPGTRNEHDTLIILRWLDENNTEFYDSIILHDGTLKRTRIKDNSTIYVKSGSLSDHEKTNFLINSLINESEISWEDFKSRVREVVFEWRSYGIYTHTHFVLDDITIDAHRPMPRNAYSIFFGDVEENIQNISEDVPENITEINETQDPEPVVQDLNLNPEPEIEQPEVENKELELDITSPKSGQEVNNNSFEVSADVDGIDPDCVVKLDDEPYQDMFIESGKASHTFLDLSDGEHSLIIRCVDDSGDSKISMLDFSVITSQEPEGNNDEYVGTETDSPKITGAYFMRGDILTASILAIATAAVLSYLYFFKNKKPPFGLKWLKFGKVREQPQTFL